MAAWLTSLALVAVVSFAFTVEAALGFGATIVTVALGSLLVPTDQLLHAFVPVNVLVSVALVVRGRDEIAWRLLLVGILPPVLLGLPAGVLAADAFHERTLKLVFGGFVLVLAALEIHRSRRAPHPGAAAGHFLDRPLLLLGGVVHGMFATGGPMVVYVLGRTLGGDKGRFRATLSVLWLVLNSALVATFALRGQLSLQSARTSAGFLVALLLGLWVGQRVHDRVDALRFRTFVFGMLAVVGVVLVLRNLG